VRRALARGACELDATPTLYLPNTASGNRSSTTFRTHAVSIPVLRHRHTCNGTRRSQLVFARVPRGSLRLRRVLTLWSVWGGRTRDAGCAPSGVWRCTQHVSPWGRATVVLSPRSSKHQHHATRHGVTRTLYYNQSCSWCLCGRLGRRSRRRLRCRSPVGMCRRDGHEAARRLGCSHPIPQTARG
jgi:hypothetical protein